MRMENGELQYADDKILMVVLNTKKPRNPPMVSIRVRLGRIKSHIFFFFFFF